MKTVKMAKMNNFMAFLTWNTNCLTISYNMAHFMPKNGEKRLISTTVISTSKKLSSNRC